MRVLSAQGGRIHRDVIEKWKMMSAANKNGSFNLILIGDKG